MERIAFRAMGCQMLAVVDSAGPAVRAILAEVPGWFATWEQCLSRFRPDSELSRINHRARSGWITVSPTLWAALETALEAARASDGLVTPTVLAALERAGYDWDFAVLDREPEPRRGSAARGGRSDTLQPSADGATLSSDALNGTATSVRPPARARSVRRRRGSERATWCHGVDNSVPARRSADTVRDWRAIRLDPGRRRIALPAGAGLDLGGSAKGWAADRAARKLAAYGPALVDAGGDIAVTGPRADGSPWPVGVADPLHPGAELDLLLLSAGGVATSGRDLRRWHHGGVEQHHLIDPRTGQPATTDLLAATIVGPDVQEAEMAAKVVMLLGRDGGLHWLAARPQLAGLLVTAAGRVIRTATLAPYRWREPANAGVLP
ncbi:MAG: hypothetical protein OHK0015_36320 [Chloroflexi bacterium OHK40]